MSSDTGYMVIHGAEKDSALIKLRTPDVNHISHPYLSLVAAIHVSAL